MERVAIRDQRQQNIHVTYAGTSSVLLLDRRFHGGLDLFDA